MHGVFDGVYGHNDPDFLAAAVSPAEGDTPKQKAEAKKKAFKRAIEDAHKAILIVTREIDDIQYV